MRQELRIGAALVTNSRLRHNSMLRLAPASTPTEGSCSLVAAGGASASPASSLVRPLMRPTVERLQGELAFFALASGSLVSRAGRGGRFPRGRLEHAPRLLPRPRQSQQALCRGWNFGFAAPPRTKRLCAGGPISAKLGSSLAKLAPKSAKIGCELVWTSADTWSPSARSGVYFGSGFARTAQDPPHSGEG